MEMMKMSELKIYQAESSEQIAQARRLFEEYATSLGFSLCFQGFDKELAGLPGDYAPPSGRLLLANYSDEVAGCVALHPFGSESICEMKRLYVRPQFRGRQIGQQLVASVIEDAKRIGYERLRLDTITSKMQKAIEIYRAYGFQEIPSYRENPIDGVIYMELELTTAVLRQD
jgi:putative acetyltransferase